MTIRRGQFIWKKIMGQMMNQWKWTSFASGFQPMIGFLQKSVKRKKKVINLGKFLFIIKKRCNHNHLFFFNLNLFSRFYPYIMLLSCLFLLITLIIYSAIPKLLNHYTRIMRHYVVTIMVAFLILAIQNLIGKLDKTSPGACKFLGL